MTKKARRRYTPEQKAEILRRHFGDKAPVSDLCDELGIQPSVFYAWQRQMLENLASAFEDGRSSRARASAADQERQRREAVEAKLARKNEVIAEISQELIELKKRSNGES